MTNSQVAELLFADAPSPAPSGGTRTDAGAHVAANRTLQKLWDNRWLARKRVVLTSLRTGQPYVHFVNVLTEAGAALVAEYYRETDGPQRPHWTPEVFALGNQTVEHRVAIYDFYALAVRACRNRGVRFAGWQDDRQLAAHKQAGRTRLISVPDATFALGKSGAGAKAAAVVMVEVDRGTESVFGLKFPRRDWKSKIEGYLEYIANFYQIDPFFARLPPPVVLTVTTSLERMFNLLSTTIAVGGGGEFWFTTAEKLEAAAGQPRWHPFWQPVWVRADTEQTTSLTALLGPK